MAEQDVAGGGLLDSRRVEAFSDGIFAIAATLLVLDLAVPSRDAIAHGGLARALAQHWLARFAVGTLFYRATIGRWFAGAIAPRAVQGGVALYYCFNQLRVRYPRIGYWSSMPTASRRRSPSRTPSRQSPSRQSPPHETMPS